MNIFSGLTNATYFDATIAEWAAFILVVLLLYLTLAFSWPRFLRKAKGISERSARTWDDVVVHLIGRTSKLSLLSLLLYACFHAMDLPESSAGFFSTVLKIGFFYQLAIWVDELSAYFLRAYLAKRHGSSSGDQIQLSAYSAISVSSKFIVWTLLLLLLLDNLGVDISALITGLGIGGIAIALAMQNILGDIFASLSIVMDRPFEVGDFIIIGDKMGTVETIGLKTSRIKSLSGEQLIFPNRKLVDSEVQNFKRMRTRRVMIRFGVVYDCTVEQLRSIPEIVREIFASLGDAVIDRVHCFNFAESSIDFEVVYIMQTADYNAYMDLQQDFNFRLFKRFSEEGIAFAFPTRTIHLQTREAPPIR